MTVCKECVSAPSSGQTFAPNLRHTVLTRVPIPLESTMAQAVSLLVKGCLHLPPKAQRADEDRT